MALYLVTGGAGFIGSHIVHTLVQQGKQVRVLDNLSTGSLANIQDVLDAVTFIHGDITDLNTVREAMQGVDYVLHQAALPSVPLSIERPLDTDAANVRGTLHLLVAARDAGVKRFVFASSSSVYGEQEGAAKVETMLPAPISPYGASKAAGEMYCLAFYHTYGLPTVILRYFNVFGPRQNPDSPYAAVIPRFISALLRGEPPTIFGDGQQSRDFCYVSNVVDANLRACRARHAPGQVFNIATSRPNTVLDLFHTLRELTGAEVEPIFAPPRPGDIRHSAADISKARAILGYEPKVGFHEGLARTVLWFRQQAGLGT